MPLSYEFSIDISSIQPDSSDQAAVAISICHINPDLLPEYFLGECLGGILSPRLTFFRSINLSKTDLVLLVINKKFQCVTIGYTNDGSRQLIRERRRRIQFSVFAPGPVGVLTIPSHLYFFLLQHLVRLSKT